MKKRIIGLVIERLENMRAVEMEAYRAHKDVSVKAPSAMESHSDTTKFQESQIADETLQKAELIQRILEELRAKGGERYDLACVGAIMKVKEMDKESYFCMVPEGAGGQMLEVEKTPIVTISTDSLLGKELLGKGKGETAVLQTPAGMRTIQILEVD